MTDPLYIERLGTFRRIAFVRMLAGSLHQDAYETVNRVMLTEIGIVRREYFRRVKNKLIDDAQLCATGGTHGA